MSERIGMIERAERVECEFQPSDDMDIEENYVKDVLNEKARKMNFLVKNIHKTQQMIGMLVVDMHSLDSLNQLLEPYVNLIETSDAFNKKLLKINANTENYIKEQYKSINFNVRAI